jgi:hypothetical protein
LTAETFLSRCQKVKRTGPGRWICCCPAHEDKTPSMNVKELPDGKVLVICRAGCTNEEIIQAAGVHWTALFPAPDNTTSEYRREAARFPAQEVLAALDFELEIARIGLADIINGTPISDLDKARYAIALRRIQQAIRIARGEH